MREKALIKLLSSIKSQVVFPDEIIIVDGSTNDKTQKAVNNLTFKNLHYFKVDDKNRGLTKQRNFGVSKIDSDSEIICFLDDDTILKNNYFEKLNDVFLSDKNITGIGGVAINENRWELKVNNKKYNKFLYYTLDGYFIKEGLRNVLRNILGLQSNLKPGKMPIFSHGRTYSYPLNGKIHEVDLLVGMSFSFRKRVLENIKFSSFFEGYGLYEDADFSLRALAFGKNVIATSCQLYHFHDQGGRPNKFKYGKMVIRNGWYVWRVKFPKPKLLARFKWNAIVIILMLLRFVNIFTTKKRTQAFSEFLGRFYGLITLIFNKPKVMR